MTTKGATGARRGEDKAQGWGRGGGGGMAPGAWGRLQARQAAPSTELAETATGAKVTKSVNLPEPHPWE